MIKLDEKVGLVALQYVIDFGTRARARLSDHLSQSLGSHDWDKAYFLHRVYSRLLEMENAGYLDKVVVEPAPADPRQIALELQYA